MCKYREGKRQCIWWFAKKECCCNPSILIQPNNDCKTEIGATK